VSTARKRVRDLVLRKIFALNFKARHSEFTVASSVDDDVMPSERLLDLSIKSIELARRIDLSDIVDIGDQAKFVNVWPGQHYRLLAAMVDVLKPTTVIEVGTYTGLSALSLLKHLRPSSRLITYDLFAWNSFSNTVINRHHFSNNMLEQRIGDLSEDDYWLSQKDVFEKADFIFIDGPKDGVFEYKLMKRITELRLSRKPIVFLDDIRLIEMLDLWRGISMPKLDLSSFGHFCGSGLVDLNFESKSVAASSRL
jgi:predicted O-methyltransferase YrrM